MRVPTSGYRLKHSRSIIITPLWNPIIRKIWRCKWKNAKIWKYTVFSRFYLIIKEVVFIFRKKSEVPERDAAGGYKAPSFDSSNFYRLNMILTRFFLCFCINSIETARWRSKCRRDICLTVSKSFVGESKFFVKRVNFHPSSLNIKSNISFS